MAKLSYADISSAVWPDVRPHLVPLATKWKYISTADLNRTLKQVATLKTPQARAITRAVRTKLGLVPPPQLDPTRFSPAFSEALATPPRLSEPLSTKSLHLHKLAAKQ